MPALLPSEIIQSILQHALANDKWHRNVSLQLPNGLDLPNAKRCLRFLRISKGTLPTVAQVLYRHIYLPNKDKLDSLLDCLRKPNTMADYMSYIHRIHLPLAVRRAIAFSPNCKTAIHGLTRQLERCSGEINPTVGPSNNDIDFLAALLTGGPNDPLFTRTTLEGITLLDLCLDVVNNVDDEADLYEIEEKGTADTLAELKPLAKAALSLSVGSEGWEVLYCADNGRVSRPVMMGMLWDMAHCLQPQITSLEMCGESLLRHVEFVKGFEHTLQRFRFSAEQDDILEDIPDSKPLLEALQNCPRLTHLALEGLVDVNLSDLLLLSRRVQFLELVSIGTNRFCNYEAMQKLVDGAIHLRTIRLDSVLKCTYGTYSDKRTLQQWADNEGPSLEYVEGYFEEMVDQSDGSDDWDVSHPSVRDIREKWKEFHFADHGCTIGHMRDLLIARRVRWEDDSPDLGLPCRGHHKTRHCFKECGRQPRLTDFFQKR